ncbi:MAG: trehalose-phosphatase [Vicinamibacteria bacterium]|nr:trehalose-phosphatase [Vicinamibacteria bacterium]
MKNILAADQRGLLAPFAWSDTLLAFDFDGTPAPIVTEPSRAALRPLTRDLLRQVAALYPCAVISGRALPDLTRRVGGLGLRGLVGNHGVEPFGATRMIHKRILDWRPQFEDALRDERGVAIEDKTYSLAIHFRYSRAKKRVRAKVEEVASGLERARLIGGIEVMNVVPTDAPHKGMALERERRRLSCDTAIYIGDDETDEDVFALDQPGRLLTVRVGPKSTSRANFYIRSQADIDSFLSALIRLREGKKSALKTPR